MVRKFLRQRAVAVIAAGSLFLASGMTAFAAPAVQDDAQVQQYPVCMVEGCNTAQQHEHDGTIYCGHSYGDGHAFHQLCSVEGCVQTGVHTHGEQCYFAHCANDGHSYCAVAAADQNQTSTAGCGGNSHHSRSHHGSRHHG